MLHEARPDAGLLHKEGQHGIWSEELQERSESGPEQPLMLRVRPPAGQARRGGAESPEVELVSLNERALVYDCRIFAACLRLPTTSVQHHRSTLAISRYAQHHASASALHSASRP